MLFKLIELTRPAWKGLRIKPPYEADAKQISSLLVQCLCSDRLTLNTSMANRLWESISVNSHHNRFQGRTCQGVSIIVVSSDHGFKHWVESLLGRMPIFSSVCDSASSTRIQLTGRYICIRPGRLVFLRMRYMPLRRWIVLLQQGCNNKRFVLQVWTPVCNQSLYLNRNK